MNRRNFLFLAFVSALAGTTIKTLASAKVYVSLGKLGYKIPGNSGRQCIDCKHYQDADEDGLCNLQVMKNVMKSQQVHVKSNATCNMWIQK